MEINLKERNNRLFFLKRNLQLVVLSMVYTLIPQHYSLTLFISA